MRQFIRTVQAKPRIVRQYYAFGFAMLCTLVLAGVWVTTLPAKFSFLTEEAAIAQIDEAPVENRAVDPVIMPATPEDEAGWRDRMVAAVGRLFAPAPTEEPVPQPSPASPPQPWNEQHEASRIDVPASSTPVLIATTSRSGAGATSTESSSSSGAVLQ